MNVGDRVKHMITGFEGIAIGITTYLAGCDQVGVQPESLHDGKTISIYIFLVLWKHLFLRYSAK